MQIQPRRGLSHVQLIGQHIAHVNPDVVICLGDWWDMHSLSSYDRGKRSGENNRYTYDVIAGNEAMDLLVSYIPVTARKVFLIGNHEQRIERFVDDHAELEGLLGYHNLNLPGWEVFDFLDTVKIDGVTYSHFFPRSADGRVMQNKSGARTARMQASREHMSCTAGHLQGFDYHESYTGSGIIQSMIVGSAYPYKLSYLTHQGQDHFRGTVVKRFYKKGQYDFERYSLEQLKLLLDTKKRKRPSKKAK